jgi:hypothetical protein
MRRIPLVALASLAVLAGCSKESPLPEDIPGLRDVTKTERDAAKAARGARDHRKADKAAIRAEAAAKKADELRAKLPKEATAEVEACAEAQATAQDARYFALIAEEEHRLEDLRGSLKAKACRAGRKAAWPGGCWSTCRVGGIEGMAEGRGRRERVRGRLTGSDRDNGIVGNVRTKVTRPLSWSPGFVGDPARHDRDQSVLAPGSGLFPEVPNLSQVPPSGSRIACRRTGAEMSSGCVAGIRLAQWQIQAHRFSSAHPDGDSTQMGLLAPSEPIIRDGASRCRSSRDRSGAVADNSRTGFGSDACSSPTNGAALDGR